MAFKSYEINLSKGQNSYNNLYLIRFSGVELAEDLLEELMFVELRSQFSESSLRMDLTGPPVFLRELSVLVSSIEVYTYDCVCSCYLYNLEVFIHEHKMLDL